MPHTINGIGTWYWGKTKVFTRMGACRACGAYAEPGSFRSVADVVDAESLQKVRDFKKAAKAAVRAKG